MKLPRTVAIGQDLLARLLDRIRHNPALLLHVPEARHAIAQDRYRSAGGADGLRRDAALDRALGGVVAHHVGKLEQFRYSPRNDRLISALRTIERIDRGAAGMRVLSLGTRTEMEILSLLSIGFHPDRLTGLDLFSYSPFIQIGTMTDLPFPDAGPVADPGSDPGADPGADPETGFDLVICGWAISYCDQPKRACEEIMRVLRPGGIVAFGCTYSPQGARATPDDRYRNPRIADLKEMFDGRIAHFYVQQDAEDPGRESSVIAIFRLAA